MNQPTYTFFTNHYACDANTLFSHRGDANCIVISTHNEEEFLKDVDVISKSYGKEAVQYWIDEDKESAEEEMIDADKGWDEYDGRQQRNKIMSFKTDMKGFLAKYKVVGMNELAKEYFQRYQSKWAKKQAKMGNKNEYH